MVLNLGKNKSADDETVREETFRRWREASLRSQGLPTEPASAPAQPKAVELTRAVELTTAIVDDDVAEEVARSTFAPIQTSIQSPVQTTVQTQPPLPEPVPPQVEEIRMDSMRAVEWPDPRASLAAPPAPEPVPAPAARRLERIKTSPESSQRPTPTSKLAQFVSSGLSATGLLGASKPVPARGTVEVLRAVDSRQLEVENVAPKPVIKTQPVELSPEDDIKRRYGSNIRSALGPGTIIEGTFSFDSPVSIEGTLIGEVRSNSVLIVGSQAIVKARVKVGSLIVFGEVQGDVESEELVEIKSGGSLEGDVLSQRFAIEDGGWFQGRSTPTMSPFPAKKAAEPAKKSFESGQFLVGEELPQLRAASDKWSIE